MAQISKESQIYNYIIFLISQKSDVKKYTSKCDDLYTTIKLRTYKSLSDVLDHF